MILTYFSRALIAAAIGLALLSVVIFVKPGPEQWALSIMPATVTVNMKEVKAHVKTPFEFTLTNSGPRTWKIVGTPSICSGSGCVWLIDPPTELPPNQSVTFHYLCNANQIGSMGLETAIYLEAEKDVGITIPVTFLGTVLESGEVSGLEP